MANVGGQNNLFSRNVLTKKCELNLKQIRGNISNKLQKILSKQYEGKCILEGYIKKNSCTIISYSSGTIKEGNTISFQIVFACEVCLPMEGMKVECVVKNVTKAGIRAEIDEETSPLIIFLARDHHYQNTKFTNINPGDKVSIKIIGKRYELNDSYISIIGELDNSVQVKKARLQIDD